MDKNLLHRHRGYWRDIKVPIPKCIEREDVRLQWHVSTEQFDLLCERYEVKEIKTYQEFRAAHAIVEGYRVVILGSERLEQSVAVVVGSEK